MKRVVLLALPLALSFACASTKPVVSETASKYLSISGNRIELKDKVYFETGSAVIKSESNDLLDAVASVLSTNDFVKLSIEGHTDSTGDAELNKKLSQSRAESVVAYLVGKGIADARLAAVGHGQEKPIASNDSEEGRAENRRVEFRIQK